MTRTIETSPAPESPIATGRQDPTAAIIADFRATMGHLKRASSERLVRLGISTVQLHVLFTLQRSGEMTMSQVADFLNVSLSNATGLIDRLEERGYIERHRVPEDRRIVLVGVTPAGEAMLAEIDALSDDLLRSVLERLPPSQLRGVAHAFAALREAVDAGIEPAPHRHPVSTSAPRSGGTLSDDQPKHAQGRE